MLRSFHTILISFTIAALALFSSCEDKINFGGDIKEIPILYCVLDQADSIHYVKLTKSIAGDLNSIDVAKIADSNYFKNPEITITEFISNVKERSWKLRDTTISGKANGAFYGPDQKLYYFSTIGQDPLNPDAKYTLKVNVNGGEFTVEGATELVKGMAINSPAPKSSMSFFANNAYSSYLLKFTPGSAAVVNTFMDINYSEEENGVTTLKTFTWNLGDKSGSDIANNNGIVSASGQQFYELFKNNIAMSSGNVKRRLKSVQIVVTGGSTDFFNYISVNQPSNGIAQNKPTFTNLTCSDGRKVVGIFSSRHKVVQFKLQEPIVLGDNSRAIDQKSTEVLCQGSITSALGFCSKHPSDAQKSFSCN